MLRRLRNGSTTIRKSPKTPIKTVIPPPKKVLRGAVCVRQLGVTRPRANVPPIPRGKPRCDGVCQVGGVCKRRDRLRAVHYHHVTRPTHRGRCSSFDNVHRALVDINRLSMMAHVGHGGTQGPFAMRWLGRHTISRRVVDDVDTKTVRGQNPRPFAAARPHTVIPIACTGGNGVGEGSWRLRHRPEWCRVRCQSLIAAPIARVSRKCGRLRVVSHPARPQACHSAHVRCELDALATDI